MNNRDFLNLVRFTENQVSPAKTSVFSILSHLVRMLPVRWQKTMTQSAAKKTPYISFIVDPYALFLSCRILDVEEVQRQLPPHYRLIPSTMYEGQKKQYSAIIGAFNVRSNFFSGSRLELYHIVEDTRTGMITWIIGDYLTDTISTDPGQGMTGASAKSGIVTTTCNGDVVIDFQSLKYDRHYAMTARIANCKSADLEQRLWVQGNLSIDYAPRLNDGEYEPFGLIFNRQEMKEALNIPISNTSIDHDSFTGPLIETQPHEAACFPFAQHFITPNAGIGSPLRTDEELDAAAMKFTQK